MSIFETFKDLLKTPKRLSSNAEAFQSKRRSVLCQTPKRFHSNVRAF